jgi:hypothetical protein
MDYESGITGYYWALGTSPFTAGVVPLTPLSTARVLKDIRFSGGTKRMFVVPVVRCIFIVTVIVIALCMKYSWIGWA